MALDFASAELSEEEFRDRRDRARRSGDPAWLWREVSVAHWADAMTHLSHAIGSLLKGQSAELPVIDPRAMSLASYTSGMGPLLGWWVESGLLSGPAETLQLLLLHLDRSRARSEQTEKHYRRIVSELSRFDVPVIVLKGGHTSHAYFPEPATRPASDLDLLIPGDRVRTAGAALTEAGLKCLARGKRESSWVQPGASRIPRSLWLLGPRDPWSIDLHSSLDASASPGAPIIRFDSANPFSTTERSALGASARSLSQPLLLLHLAVHASGGLQSLTLLRMVEMVFVIRSDFGNRRSAWERFVAVGRATGALGGAYPALCMCERLAPGTVPANVLALAAESAPTRVRSVVEKLTPANAQRVSRASISEHFMWVTGMQGWLRQLAADILPSSGSGDPIRSIYEARAYRLLRRRITR
jgi:hypothetical protein